MDPTHFIASHTISSPAAKTDVQDFYDAHSLSTLHRVRRVTSQLIVRWRRRGNTQSDTPAFAVSHPAE